ncbi:MAG: hypothetical protein AMXMBFR64_13900 [Myxococcales bacterium]
MSKAASFRKLLASDGPIVITGAHNGISARLVEEAGFEGVWASGFEISASYALPDANILTMAENVTVAKAMNDACTIPVIADCDNGYGNAINVIRTVQEYEKAGIAGICIEDNVFPKRCSFYAGVRRELAPVAEHAGKIQAAKAAQKDPDFVVIARTEALIAGWGMEEALKRGRAYADAGADMVLIHSKSPNPAEVMDFARRWDRKTPLVCVPTIYKEATVTQLYEAGFKMIIFANHAMRSSIKAMQEALNHLHTMGFTGSVEDRIVPLKEVYRLVGEPEMKANEKCFLPPDGEQVTAIILAAGYEKQLGALIEDRPKSMLDVRGKTIIQRQVEALNAANIKNIAVVRGYKKEMIDLPNIRTYDNEDFAEGGELGSLFSAAPELKGRVLVLYGDILFDRSIVEKLLKSPDDVTIVADRAWRDTRVGRQGGRPDLVAEKQAPPAGIRYLAEDATTEVEAIGASLDPEAATGEFIGMMMLTDAACRKVEQVYREVMDKAPAGRFHEAESLRRASLTDLLQELIHRGETVGAVGIYKGWMEVDTFEDYQRAWATLK